MDGGVEPILAPFLLSMNRSATVLKTGRSAIPPAAVGLRLEPLNREWSAEHCSARTANAQPSRAMLGAPVHGEGEGISPAPNLSRHIATIDVVNMGEAKREWSADVSSARRNPLVERVRHSRSHMFASQG